MSINKKIIKKFYNSLENSDFDSLNELWHDDVTLTLIGSTPVSGDFKGKDSTISLIEKGVLANLQFDKVIFANEWSIIAAENAKFGQPEITLGIIPGSGGTQRLTRIVGKSKAMEMILTGRTMDASEAEAAGLVSRVVPLDSLIDESIKIAEKIAQMSLPAILLAKESVNRSYESSLNEGLLFERRMFHSSFALEDQKEGMSAFIEKRRPSFKNR